MAEDARLGDYRMDEEECWGRLHDHPTYVGRLGFVQDGRPVILPLNFRADGRTVVFRTTAGAKLSAVVDGQLLAFEVDEVDAGWQTGWSVLAQGRAHIVDDEREMRRLEQLGLRAWASGRQDEWIVLTPDTITGRHIA